MPEASPISRNFGCLPDGRPVASWLLSGPDGFQAEVIEWGATVHRLVVPDREGFLADVALGFDDLNGYLENIPCFGSIIGRVAGRIPESRFEVDGHEYLLDSNDGGHHLHGGAGGFHRKLWKSELIDGRNEVRFTLESAAGEGGYPGRAIAEVRYSIENRSTLRVVWRVEVDHRGPVALTNHTYFHLGGEGQGTIEEHTFRIPASEYALVDRAMIPTGSRSKVSRPGNDLRVVRKAAEFLPEIYARHGDYYFLDFPAVDGTALAAEVIDPRSGRVLRVFTNEPGVQLYTGAMLRETRPVKRGGNYPAHAGFCLECQGFAGSVRYPSLGSILVSPGVPVERTIEFAFSTTQASHD